MTLAAGAMKLTSAGSTSSSANGSVSSVQRRTGAFTSFGGVIQANAGTGFGYNNSANTGAMYKGVVGSFAMTDSAFHATQAVFNGASSSVLMDGTSTTGLNPGGTSLLGGQVQLGILNGSNSLTGDICLAGITPTQFSGGQSSSLRSLATTYWGTP